MRIRHDDRVRADRHARVDVGGSGVGHADAVQHVRPVDALAQGGFCLRQVHAGIDADGLDQVIVQHGLYGQVILDGELHHVGQIILALLRIHLDAMQRIPQPLGLGSSTRPRSARGWQAVLAWPRILRRWLARCRLRCARSGQSRVGPSAITVSRLSGPGVVVLGLDKPLEGFAAQQRHIRVGDEYDSLPFL